MKRWMIEPQPDGEPLVFDTRDDAELALAAMYLPAFAT
jgi:hypothetical protein